MTLERGGGARERRRPDGFIFKSLDGVRIGVGGHMVAERGWAIGGRAIGRLAAGVEGIGTQVRRQLVASGAKLLYYTIILLCDYTTILL